MLGKMVTGEGQTYNREANGTIDGYCGRHHVKCMHWPLSHRNPLVRTEQDRPYFFSLFRLPPPPLFWNGVKPVPICRTISGEGGGRPHQTPARPSHSRQHNDFDGWRSADSMTLNWQRREGERNRKRREKGEFPSHVIPRSQVGSQ